MYKLSQEDLLKWKEIRTAIIQRANSVCELIKELELTSFLRDCHKIDSIKNIDEEDIIFNTSDSFMGHCEYGTAYIPMKYFLDDNWEEEIRKQYEDKINKEKQELKRKQEKQEEYERKEYDRLKNKFGNNL